MPKDRIFLQFFQVLNEQNLDEADNLLTAETEFYFPKMQPMVGKNRILKFLKIFFRQSSGGALDQPRDEPTQRTLRKRRCHPAGNGKG